MSKFLKPTNIYALFVHFLLNMIELFHQDTYAAELYAFVCKETELVNLFMEFYRYHGEYHQNVALTIQRSLPLLDNLYGKN